MAPVRAQPSVPARLLRTAASLAVVVGLAAGATGCRADNRDGDDDGGSDTSLIAPETADAETTDTETTPSSCRDDGHRPPAPSRARPRPSPKRPSTPSTS